MIITLPHHVIDLRLNEQLVVTRFRDGVEAHACPHDTDEYRAHAAAKSNGDTMAYCWQHDLMHCLLAEAFLHAPSPTLWAVAHGDAVDTPEIQAEEQFVQEFQKALMMHECSTGDYPIDPPLFARR